MKKKLLWLPMLAVVALCFGLQACSNDDDDGGSSNSPIVGQWFCPDSSDALFVFKANGTGTCSDGYVDDSGNFVKEDTWPITYVFDLDAKKLTVTDVEDPNDTYVDIYEIVEFAPPTMKLKIYGETYTYTKQ